MKKKSIGLASIILFVVVQGIYAVPPGFNIQGRLTDANGINRNGVYSIKFTIFDAATGGTELWSKTYPSPGNPPAIPPTAAVTVRNGNFQIILQDPDNTGRNLADAVNTLTPYLEIQVIDGPDLTQKPEPALVPRQALVSVPFALKSQTAEQGMVPAGAIMAFVSVTPPPGWLLCQGQRVSKETYADLFGVIGCTFGCDATTFKLPDLRGEFIRGFADGIGVDSGRIFGSGQSDAVGPHIHKSLVSGENERYGSGSRNVAHENRTWEDTSQPIPYSNETRPRNVALSYIIKY